MVNEYVQRETVNRKEDLCVPRVFLQGKFQKPFSKSLSATSGELHKLGKAEGLGGSISTLLSTTTTTCAPSVIVSHMMRQGFLKADSASSNFTTVRKTCNDLEFTEAEA